MKKTCLSYHKNFPSTPISGWAGANWCGWITTKTKNGQWRNPKSVPHPFLSQRKLWCRLEVHFQDIDLRFAMPAELDQFLDIMLQNPLPSGHRLIPGLAYGRPNAHWLSRLPKKAKPWIFRQKLCKFLRTAQDVTIFRNFYASQPIQFEFDGYYDYHTARRMMSQSMNKKCPP